MVFEEKNVPSRWSLIRLGTIVLKFWKYFFLDYSFKRGKNTLKEGMMVELKRDKEVDYQQVCNIADFYFYFFIFYSFLLNFISIIDQFSSCLMF